MFSTTRKWFSARSNDDNPTPTAANAQSDAAALGRYLNALMLDVDRVAQSIYLGAHGRRRPGTGERFWQFREYASGEATTRIDWRQSAKREGTYVREMEWEAGQTTLFWVDPSDAMAFSSDPDRLPTKHYRALLLSLALSRLLVRGGEFVGASAGSPGGQARASGSKNAVPTLAEALIGQRDSHPPITPPPHNAHGLWFTDGLTNGAELGRALAIQRARRTGGLLIQMADPTEIDFPFKGRIRFVGTAATNAEAAQTTTIDRSEGVRVGYLSKMATHRDELHGLARSTGWRFLTLSTGDSAEANLADLVAALGVRQ